MASAQPQTARRLALYLVHMLLLHTKDGAWIYFWQQTARRVDIK